MHRNADGSFGPPRNRGSQDEELVVPSQSLLKTPQRVWEEHPELRQQMSRSSFYALMKGKFAEFRGGARRTDICSHCKVYYKEIIPNFRKDAKQLSKQLKQAYNLYVAHYDFNRTFDSVYEEASYLLQYIATHSNAHREEREQSRCDLLHLYSFTEAPAEVLLPGHRSLLRSYEWHLLSSRRQRDSLEQLLSHLPHGDSVVIYDWKEKVKLPQACDESDMWHMQQKYSVAVFGACIYSHAQESTVQKPVVKSKYLIYTTEIREQTAEAANRMLDKLLQDHGSQLSSAGRLLFYSDCGPHFRSHQVWSIRCRSVDAASRRSGAVISGSSTGRIAWTARSAPWAPGCERPPYNVRCSTSSSWSRCGRPLRSKPCFEMHLAHSGNATW